MNSIKTPNILFVAHHPVSGQWVGGIEVYLVNIAKVLSQKYGVFIYTPKMDSHGLSSQIVDGHGKLVREISYPTPYSNWQLTDPEREQAFAKILDELDIGLVHFHHLAGHPPSLITVANQKEVPTVFSVHDFFSICHVSNLINHEGRYCNPASLTMQQCDNCLSNSYGVLPGSQLKRRSAWRELLASCHALIFNTQSSVELITSIYPGIGKHPNQYLAPVPILPITRAQKQPIKPNPLKVAVMGNFLHHKGADTILSAMKALQNEAIEFHVFGNVDSVYLEQMGSLLEKSVCLHGPYSPEKMPAALWDCHVSLHVSIVPETYCLTLSEASTIGLVPVVTDIGALGERVTQNVNGLKIEVGSVEQLCSSLRSFSASPNMLSNLQNPAIPVPCAQMAEHLNILQGIYDPLIKSNTTKLPDDLNAEQLAANTTSTSTHWANFPDQKPPSTSQSNYSIRSFFKSALLRVLR